MTVFGQTSPHAAMLADNRRLHLQHGPIDLIVSADGATEEVAASYRQAAEAFGPVLTELMDEIDLLRSPVCPRRPQANGVVGGAMVAATSRFAGEFVTPMAAVAGCVADHVLAAMIAGRKLRRASVNNGGDIALHLTAGQSYKLAVCTDPVTGEQGGTVVISHGDPVRGIATSGWRGRSHSLGAADAVTVLAKNVGVADAAATLIANAVLPDGICHSIVQTPANVLSPDSDLGDRLVTTRVGGLSHRQLNEALENGVQKAETYMEAGLIVSALISVQGETRVIGQMAECYRLGPTNKPPQTGYAGIA